MDSEKLKQIRSEIGFTPGQMVDALELSKRTYEKWESGERQMTGANNTAVLSIAFLVKNKLFKKFEKWRKDNA